MSKLLPPAVSVMDWRAAGVCSLLFAAGFSVLFISSCRPVQEHELPARLIPIREAIGYVVPQDSIEAPIVVEIDERHLKKESVTNPRRVATSSQSVPAQLTKAVPLDTLRICIPGHDAFDMPTGQTMLIKPVPAPTPEIVLVKDMQGKDYNSSNFGIYGVLQGLKYPHVLRMMEDRGGNLWFCTEGAFTKYDGKFFSHFIIQKDLQDWTCYIQEDTFGNIWFGTRDELVKYDGRTFAHLTGINGPHPVTPYLVEKSGTIWAALQSGGINKIMHVPGESGGLLNFTLLHFGRKEGFTDEIIDRILQDRSGNLWFLTRAGTELIKLEMQINDQDTLLTFLHFKVPDLLTDLDAPDILEDHDGALWFTCKGGLLKYDGDSLVLVSDAASDGAQMFPRMVDRAGNIWGSIYMKGIFKYARPDLEDSGTFTHFSMREGLSNDHTDVILEDRHGGLWIGTLDGVNLYRGGVMTHLTTNEGLARPPVMGIEEDRSGNLWFASTGEGIFRYDGSSFGYYDVEDGLCNAYVRSIQEDRKGNLWVGTLDGVSRYTPSGENGGGTFTNFIKSNGLDGSTYDICEDHAGNIWIGQASSDARLYCYTPPLGNGPGLLMAYAPARVLSDANIACIVEDNDRNLWFGTERGVTRYTPPTSHHPAIFCHFLMKDGISDNSIRSIVKDYRGNLWFGTLGNGLIYFNGKSFVALSEKEGLSNNFVISGLSDRAGNIWFGTHSGLNMLPKNSVDTIAEKVATGTLRESDIRFRTYLYEDGFVGMSCNTNSIFEDKNGTIWVGANDRVTAYHPEGDIRDTFSPHIQITGIDLFNESVDWAVLDQYPDSSVLLNNGIRVAGIKCDSLSNWYGVPENLSLSHDNNYITFRFIGITMSRPGKVKYQYRLDGLDHNWSSITSDIFATYGNIPPGKYTFKVKAMNSDRYWSPELTYPFTIRHPWWLRWWAYSLYALVIAIAGYTAMHFFKRRLLLRHQLKAKHDEALRLQELDTFKSQLFTNLTHEFRTPLTVILGMAKQLAVGSWQAAIGEKEREKISTSLGMIENNGRNLLQLINQLLDLSKLESKSFRLHSIQSDIVPYLRYITQSFQSYAEDFNLSLQFTSSVESLVMDFDPEQIKQILTNLISNAVKFTPQGGRINVHAEVVSGQLKIRVNDTGIGIAPKDLPHIMDRFYQADSSSTRAAPGTGIGLAHTQELLKVMGGSIEVESTLGKGTSVLVNLPVTHHKELMSIDEISAPSRLYIPFSAIQSNTHNTNASDGMHENVSGESMPQLLIIEDNPDVIAYLRSCLEPVYLISVAFNGKAGVEKALENIPDFIISDVMMPQMDGFQVCDKLKNDERTSHIPIILLTAKADVSSRLTGLRRGADAYMAKPFSPEELSLQISTLLENRRRMAAYFARGLRDGSTQFTIETSDPEAIRIEDAFIKKVNAIIEANYSDENFSLPELSKEIGLSRSQLLRKIKAIADTSPSDMIRSYRLKKAKALLESGDVSVSEATYQVGFKDPSYFSKLFQEEFGVKPRAITR